MHVFTQSQRVPEVKVMGRQCKLHTEMLHNSKTSCCEAMGLNTTTHSGVAQILLIEIKFQKNRNAFLLEMMHLDLFRTLFRTL